ncbi:YtxH domain-containing protein [Planococcus sp. ISL-109]|uniref:YtxH domain-containing protein n=1 Tax=Planococcus sp. ISL-109 TaxID=2819166 RepID=UPI001BEAD98D|nr:YtxH domain-containing protein [Planococcus sp. ISL-109]MBT2582547.1 YtxH domain-containing protein [Planococcus sp. ISL-109]
MGKHKNTYSKPNYNESQYNGEYYTQGGKDNDKGGRYEQSEYVPQSYGASSRYDDLYDYEDSNGGSGFVTGLLVGGLIGVAAALFFAPKAGKELQADLKTQATTLKEKTQQSKDSSDTNDGPGFTQQLKDQSNKVVDKVKNLKSSNSPMDDGTASSEGEESVELLETVQNKVNGSEKAGNDAFTSTANALKEAVEEVKEENKSSHNDQKTSSSAQGSSSSKASSDTKGSASSQGTSNKKN